MSFRNVIFITTCLIDIPVDPLTYTYVASTRTFLEVFMATLSICAGCKRFWLQSVDCKISLNNQHKHSLCVVLYWCFKKMHMYEFFHADMVYSQQSEKNGGSTLKGTHANGSITGGISGAQVLLQQTIFHIDMAHYLDSHIFSAYINGIAPFTLKKK